MPLKSKQQKSATNIEVDIPSSVDNKSTSCGNTFKLSVSELKGFTKDKTGDINNINPKQI